MFKVPDKALVNLEMIDRELLEMRQRGVTGSEVIKGNLYLSLAKLSENSSNIVRAFAEKHGFGDLNLEMLRRNIAPFKNAEDVIGKPRLAELRR